MEQGVPGQTHDVDAPVRRVEPGEQIGIAAAAGVVDAGDKYGVAIGAARTRRDGRGFLRDGDLHGPRDGDGKLRRRGPRPAEQYRLRGQHEQADNQRDEQHGMEPFGAENACNSIIIRLLHEIYKPCTPLYFFLVAMPPRM